MHLGFLLTDYFPFGGLQRDCLKIAEICVDRGHQVTLFTRTWQGEQPQKIAVKLFGRKGFTNESRNRYFFKLLRKRLPEENLDGVIGFNRMMVPMDVYFGCDPCYVAKMGRLKPAWYRWTPRYRHFKYLEEYVFRKGKKTQILLLTGHEIPFYKKCYGTEHDRFYVLPPGVLRRHFSEKQRREAMARVRLKHGYSSDENILLFIGSGFRIKGLDRVIRGLASLPYTLRNKTRLFVIGQDKPHPFVRLAKKLGVAKPVQFFGGCDDVAAFFLAADLLVHPAYSEAAGIVLLEALTMGLPVLTTDTCGYAFHIKSSGGGYVLPSPFVQTDFNHKLQSMLTSFAQESWRANALQYAAREDLYSCHEKAADIIEEVILRKKK